MYPNEVEEVVSNHPEVLEVGAIGVADERSGEAVKIVVVKRSPGLTEESLHEFCRENLAGYKRPRYVEFTHELPKSNVGKILRKDLREQFRTARPGRRLSRGAARTARVPGIGASWWMRASRPPWIGGPEPKIRTEDPSEPGAPESP